MVILALAVALFVSLGGTLLALCVDFVHGDNRSAQITRFREAHAQEQLRRF